MTSKEALEELRNKAQLLALFMGKDAGDHLVNVDTLYDIIKQALERLETLEKENKRLNKLLVGYQCNTFNEAQENVDLRQENEKLKKALKNNFNKLTELKKNFWITDNYQDYEIILTIIELLKEVLCDD